MVGTEMPWLSAQLSVVLWIALSIMEKGLLDMAGRQ